MIWHLWTFGAGVWLGALATICISRYREERHRRRAIARYDRLFPGPMPTPGIPYPGDDPMSLTQMKCFPPRLYDPEG